ncbi:4-(cytidine 5'-diphospho)-2-C-methyl-D-erythritol kinase [Eikenella sp. S3360]|uniref:4-diphosphocytidyl-2-C-methyl-D-erythritol kinase n=1 Tax=Eikenella glucosivorans TaxID=2766967 RepID=A0ABS0N7N2_9NEIS|nr:4-(cytidine 5'-diphospho)-2-C-methyl-D-erythritol kinase [Eikenella glucosivorans]MBH5328323.1 4-(cytidine 5'-diphospho)-2-C-methyl-D-erythritol kinase [Eikenella glucosivorans]
MSPHPAARPFPAPAKLNLDLRITGRRPDGYHLLESIFRLISLCDTVWLLPRRDSQIILHNPAGGIPPEQDLSHRAARLLQQFSGSLQGVEIWLDKRIPSGGGLGGGSSDAATVLLALNHLWQTAVPPEQLHRLGLSLGADVPFFLFGQSAFAQGIGEILHPIALPEQWYVVVRPNAHVSTPKIFAHPDLTRNSPPCPNPGFEQLQPFRNDMQAVVLAEYPSVAAAFRLLQDYGTPQMTGSGACLFIACATQGEAEYIHSRLPENLASWCVHGMDKHPLFAILNP